jgi:hypothetical protein
MLLVHVYYNVIILVYHHSLIVGNYYMNEENTTVILNIEKIFTNEEKKYEHYNQVINLNISKARMNFEQNSLIHKILEKDDQIVLKLHTNYKNNK